MRIVEKTTIDMIPKAITLYIINELENFITLNLSLEIVNSFGTNIVSCFNTEMPTISQIIFRSSYFSSWYRPNY